ncbi:hypothetical protein [Methyloversatilis thermotolerans]|uniref:hypothetical protein n=1 Tax=Methyloversatilis thermotolerans TaxID=1346290 RepID=UPI0004775BCA|nr:hypothetical protein [Methyloversatilis thermotolerans]
MNKYRTRALLLATGLGLLASGGAWADPGHWHGRPHVDIGFGVLIGPGYGPGYGPWYGPPRYYYPPPVVYAPAYVPPQVVIERSPPVYVEREPVASAPAPAVSPSNNVWYFCPSSNGYYPYVRACPEGWQTVAAQPPR